jgi:hypothetical protein
MLIPMSTISICSSLDNSFFLLKQLPPLNIQGKTQVWKNGESGKDTA